MEAAARIRTQSTESDSLLRVNTIPITLRWCYGGKEVFVAGTFSDWKLLPMADSELIEDDSPQKSSKKKGKLKEPEFFIIVDIPEGQHEYKFYVDGEWNHDPDEPTVLNAMGSYNNAICVNRADYANYEIIDRAVMPFDCLIIHLGDNPPLPSREPFGQKIPKVPRPPLDRSERKLLIPDLPPQLGYSILNAKLPQLHDPESLEQPSRVTLNHLYVLKIKDETLCLSATSRFREKFVTCLFIKKKGERILSEEEKARIEADKKKVSTC